MYKIRALVTIECTDPADPSWAVFRKKPLVELPELPTVLAEKVILFVGGQLVEVLLSHKGPIRERLEREYHFTYSSPNHSEVETVRRRFGTDSQWDYVNLERKTPGTV